MDPRLTEEQILAAAEEARRPRWVVEVRRGFALTVRAVFVDRDEAEAFGERYEDAAGFSWRLFFSP